MKAVLKSGSYKAVTKTGAKTFYAWGTASITIYTLSNSPTIGDDVYTDIGASSAGTVTSYDAINNTLQTNVPLLTGLTFPRYQDGDTSITGTNYKLINQ